MDYLRYSNSIIKVVQRYIKVHINETIVGFCDKLYQYIQSIDKSSINSNNRELGEILNYSITKSNTSLYQSSY